MKGVLHKAVCMCLSTVSKMCLFYLQLLILTASEVAAMDVKLLSKIEETNMLRKITQWECDHIEIVLINTLARVFSQNL